MSVSLKLLWISVLHWGAAMPPVNECDRFSRDGRSYYCVICWINALRWVSIFTGIDVYLVCTCVVYSYLTNINCTEMAYFWQNNKNWVCSSFHTNANTSLLLLISYLYTFWQQTRPHLWDQYLMLIFLPSWPLFLSTIHHTDSYFLSSPVK